MTNAVLIQMAVLAVSAVVVGIVIRSRRHTTEAPAPSFELKTKPAKVDEVRTAPTMETTIVDNIPQTGDSEIVIDVQSAFIRRDDRNERILEGISKNIQKSLQMRPVAEHSPIPYPEMKRNTEYVRVKREIITPHGNIRFQILKDWVTINMLAVFRRASLDWKTPEDLIAFLPSYLQAEAEILDREVLIIRTAGHNERLAVPIRMLHDGSALGRCFDFVTDSDAANNAPAVLLATDMQYEVISKGLIAQAAFLNALGRSEPEVQLVVQGCSPEALEKRYAAALRQIEAT